MLDHRGLQVAQVLRLERVGLVVREAAVELEVQRHQLDRQGFETGGAAEDRRHGVAGHPVAGVDDHLQAASAGDVDEAAQVLGVAAQQVALLARPQHVDLRHAVGEVALRTLAHGGEPGVLTDGPRTGPADLDAVVPRRVVRGGEHRAGAVEHAAGVVEPVGRGEADEHHVAAAGGDAVGEGVDERARRRPHVVPDDEGPPGDAEDVGARGPESGGLARAPLVGHHAAHVVGLDDRAQVRTVCVVRHGPQAIRAAREHGRGRRHCAPSRHEVPRPPPSRVTGAGVLTGLDEAPFTRSGDRRPVARNRACGHSRSPTVVA